MGRPLEWLPLTARAARRASRAPSAPCTGSTRPRSCVLLASGLCLYLPSLAEAVGRRPLLKTIHLYTALAWLVALVAVVAVGDRRSLRATVHEIDTFDRDDRDWLRHRPAPQGRLNAGQKLNAIITAAFAVLFGVTGFPSGTASATRASASPDDPDLTTG